jgi:outer membrane lipoprotein-sorting protein
MRKIFLAILAFACIASAATSEKAILARMDQAAPTFKGLTADIVRVKFTAILNDRSEESGSMSILRSGKDMRARINLVKPSPRAVAFHGDKVEVFYPKLNTVQEFDVSKSRGLIDQFLLLGFGSSGKEIAKSYTVKVAGDEKINGVNTTRVLLTPKSSKVRELLKSVEMWIPDGAAYPVRQKFVEPSDDYMEVTYHDAKVNPGLKSADLNLDLPPGVKREFPQK